MGKNLDGIKKLNSGDMEESRRIVLDFIGEKNKIKKPKPHPTRAKIPALKRVDGLAGGLAPAKVKPEKEIGAKISHEPAGKFVSAEEKRKKALKKQAEDKKEIVKKKNNYLKERIEKERRAKKAKKKKALKEARKKRKEKAVMLLNSIAKFLRRVIRSSAYILSALFFFFVLSYLVLSLVVLNLDVENSNLRKLNNFTPFPALITKIGIIDYYEFKDALNAGKSNYQGGINELKKEVKEELLKNLITENLAKKYGVEIGVGEINREEFYKKLADRMIFDEEINQISLARMKKARELIDSGQNFEEVRKYGDESISGGYIKRQEAIAKFGESIADLKIGEISNIIITPDGYYLVEKYGERDDLVGLRYVFVRAKTLDDYLNDSRGELKVISFID